MKRIIIINGTLGIGKSTVAKDLAQSIDRSCYLEGDSVTHSIPDWDVRCESKIKKAIEEIATIAKYSLKHGLSTVVIDFVFEKPEHIKYMQDLFHGLVGELRVFYLKADTQEIENRISSRARENFQLEQTRTHEILAQQSNYLDDISLGISVESSGKSVSEITEHILFQLKHRLNAAAFIKDSSGNFLFCHRRDIPNKNKGFQLPQGGIEPFEIPVETIKRELLEELFLEDYQTLAQTKQARPYYWKKGQIYDHYIGQLQYYFLIEVNDEQKKQITKSNDFDFYIWEPIDTILGNAVSYKRDVYQNAWQELKDYNQ
ncbi:MAG: NUDIX domain-containing protein [Candidatus Cloacimonetes bacterium]|nr:NUDIX domain-containing protein [Candidatus Cloacimonadota bacterium]